jgi:hypothetical protein
MDHDLVVLEARATAGAFAEVRAASVAIASAVAERGELGAVQAEAQQTFHPRRK